MAGAGLVAVGPAALRAGAGPSSQPVTLTFSLSGLDGGGGVNCLAISSGGRLVAGGDNNGPKVSTDGGSWTPAMGGLERTSLAPPTSVAWDPFGSERVWMIAGSPSAVEPHGLFVSTNGGLDWAGCTASPTVSPGADRPRIVGRCIAIPAPGLLFLGDAAGNVWRWSGYGTSGVDGTITRVARFPSEAVTSLVADPVVQGRLFVATRSRGRQLDGAHAAGGDGATVRTLSGTGAPGRIEELAIVRDPGGGAVLFAACWTQGIRRLEAAGNPAGAWSVVTPSGGSDRWCAIDANGTGGNLRVAAGSAAPARLATGGFDPVTGDSYGSVFLSDDGGAGWTSICSGVPGEGTLSNETGGPGGPPWWGYLAVTAGGWSDNRLGSPTFVPEQLVIDPTGAGRVFAVGTQGVFRFDRSTARWYPAMRGLGVTTNTAVRCDPNRAGRVIVGNVDHLAFVSDDGLATARKNERPSGVPDNAFAIALDTAVTPSRVYLASGGDTNARGEVFDASSPSAPWRSLGRPAGSAQRPLGLAVRRVSGRVIVLAAVEGKGVYRRRFDTAEPPGPVSGWGRVNGVAMTKAQGSDAAPMSWEHASVVYLFDRASGIWRSRNAGDTWQAIWRIRDNANMEGFIAADPDDPTGGTLLVTMGPKGSGPGLWRLRGCHVAGATVENGAISTTPLVREPGVPFAAPGAVVARAGRRLWIVDEGEPALFASIDAGSSWSVTAGPGFDRAIKKVSGMDVAPDGTVYLALKGPGIAVGRPG